MGVRGKTVQVKCRCGVTFTARVADRKRGWGRFCSKSCKAIRQTQMTGRGAPIPEEYRTYQDDMDEYWSTVHPGSEEAVQP
jgi:hypothetical protein